MAESNTCTQNRDPLKLVHEGSSQQQRNLKALSPDFAAVNEHGPAYGIVFAKAYSAFLNYYDSDNNANGDWQDFFAKDVSARLAVAAIADVEGYRQFVKACFEFLNDRDHQSQTEALKDQLGLLFGCLGSLALQLDRMKESLPADMALKTMLKHRIQSQLATAYRRFLRYYKAALVESLINQTAPNLSILGEAALTESDVFDSDFSKDWIVDEDAVDWSDYVSNKITEDASVFGDPAGTVFDKINHIATHNLFTGIFDEFLKVYARTVLDAGQALLKSFSERDNHEPHYALFLAFLRLFEHGRAELNALTAKHLDFYYRDILRLKEKPSEPPSVHLLVELAKQVDSHLLDQGTRFKAGKDDAGKQAFFAADSSLVVNQAKVSALKTLYRHDDEKVLSALPVNVHQGRLFASPDAASADGKGAKLTGEDLSWHPFFNKSYRNGQLQQIAMPEAEVGFAIASHYLWLAEGKRSITVIFNPPATFIGNLPDYKGHIICLLTAEKGWFEVAATTFLKSAKQLKLQIELAGDDPAVVPYASKVHGYNFGSGLPMLLVKLRHRDDSPYVYQDLQSLAIGSISLQVSVEGLRTLAVSNDFGPVDISKPFQAFGAIPKANSALVVGSKEAFQKALASATLHLNWQNPPAPFKTTVNLRADYLQAGRWEQSATPAKDIKQTEFPLAADINGTVLNQADFSKQEVYQIAARQGFVRLVTSDDFGQEQYEQALIAYIQQLLDNDQAITGSMQQSSSLLNEVADQIQHVSELNNQIIDQVGTLNADFGSLKQGLINAFNGAVAKTQEVLLAYQNVHSELANVIPNLVAGSAPIADAADSGDEAATGPDFDLIMAQIESLKGSINTALSNISDMNIANNIQVLTGQFTKVSDGVAKLAETFNSIDGLSQQILGKTDDLIALAEELIGQAQTQLSEFPLMVNDVMQSIAGMIDNVGAITASTPEKPIPPQGPFASDITLDYTTDALVMQLDKTAADAFDKRQSRFFHLAAFGQAEQHAHSNGGHEVFLLPQFLWHRPGATQSSQAEFYIGISALQPPQTLALLFQVTDGSADPLMVKPEPHIQWSYLRGNEWQLFDSHEVADTTGGLIKSGIIQFTVPDDATDDNTLLPQGMHWLRAAVESGSEAVCRLQKVAAQALPARFVDRDNDPGFAAQTLAAGTISKLEKADAAVKKIEQPFSSFGGRGAESAQDYYRRVSERLRHKDRAVALWDYQRLVLEAFPQLYRVKCLNHTQYEPSEDGLGIYRELAPGHVTLAAIPNLQVQTLRDPLRPYTSLGLLKDIEAFLRKRMSALVTLHVRNPQFEAVRCAFNVRLFDGYDGTFYVQALQQAITRFLSPWAFSNEAKPTFGGKIYKSVLIDFVEAQPYVDYVTDFRLFHDVAGANSGSVDLNEVAATTAVSILVSAPSEAHSVDELKPNETDGSEKTCPCEL